LNELVTHLSEQNGLSGDVSEVTTSDPTATTDPFAITYQVRKGGYLDWAAARSELEAPPSVRLIGTTAEEQKGLTRMFMGPPVKTRMRATIELPDGYDADAPPPVTTSKAGITFTSAYRVDGRRLSIEREFERTLSVLPQSLFGDYGVVAGIARKDFAQHFIVHRHASTSVEVPKDATAGELYHAAYSAYEAEWYTMAAQLWKRTTEVDPKMGTAWISLGLAYKELKEYDAAESAIRKQIALDANDKRAYRDLGYVLDKAGKREEAIKAYAKHIEINPLDGDALKELGYLYLDLDRHAEAAATLEKASALLKPDAWLFAQLGWACLNRQQGDKARAAFDRALEIEPSVRIRTKVGWALAAMAVDLDRAESLVTQSEKSISDATQTLDLKSLNATRLDEVESLAWDWDAMALIALHRDRGPLAERYARAAWKLLGDPEIAFHLAEALEKSGRKGEALPYYLMAQASSSSPSEEMQAGVKRLAHAEDVSVMLQNAKRMALLERLVAIDAKQPSGQADFHVVVGNDKKATAVRFFKGDDNMQSFEASLRGTTFPLDFPDEVRVRIPLQVRIECDADRGCRAGLVYPSQVTLK